MVINEKKTKLMVINGDELDRLPIPVGDVMVDHTESYVYLGAVITEDGSTASSIIEHAKEKEKNLNKLSIFLASNYEAPFYVKRKVFSAAFSASIFYGMESWIGVAAKPIESLYMKGVKALLGVRESTPNNLCLVEGGLPPLQSIVHQAQAKFFRRMMHRMEIDDDPLGHTLRLIEREDPTMWTKIQNLMIVEDHTKTGIQLTRETVSNDVKRRGVTYVSLNPELSVHNLYIQQRTYIPDSLRIGFTRVRLSSHRLRVETGRWSRIPRCERLCPCGYLQDEGHLLTCKESKQILSSFSYTESSLGLVNLFTKLDKKHLTMLNKLVDKIEHL